VDDPLGHDTRSELVDRFTESGGEIAGTDSYPISGQQFRSVLTKMRDSGADKIVMLGYGVAIPKILRQASEIGIAGNRIVGNIGFVGPNVFGLDPEVTEGAVFTGPAFTYRLRRDSLSGDTKEFVSEYRNRYGESPDYTAAFAYDALKIIARAVNNSDGTPNQVRKSLLKIKDYEGVTGDITILENGDSKTDMIVGIFKDGEIVRVEN
jgi:branched-chain amino acid transport system substrate-binding protein